MKYMIVSTVPIKLIFRDAKTDVNSEVQCPENTIVNVIEYDGKEDYVPPKDCVLQILEEPKSIGDVLNG